ncbi:phosphoprotein [Sweetwater Branch virus]|uniref:Phosphoprotein n=1 Tax=Sweetwater Branch virus TaxID=1272958 RepID=A0A0D3R1A2_9RHAB|nr:phosphoprotein [Sweetwater Branch virus]AJR28391.1 phosphoprotein [Sweetwater Branch virus]
MQRQRISIPYVTDSILTDASKAHDPNEVQDNESIPTIKILPGLSGDQKLNELLDSRELNFRTRASSTSSYDDDDWAESIIDLSKKDESTTHNYQKGGDNSYKSKDTSADLDTPPNKKDSASCTTNDASNLQSIQEANVFDTSHLYPLMELPHSFSHCIPKLQFFLKYYNLYEDVDYVIDKDNTKYYFFPTKKWLQGPEEYEVRTSDHPIESEDVTEEHGEVHALLDFLSKGFYVEKRNIKGKYYFDLNNPSLNVNKIAKQDGDAHGWSDSKKIDAIFKASGIYRAMRLKAKW